MEIEQIATFHSPFSTKFGIPRQSGLVEGLEGRIVFEPKFRNPDALRGIEDFDYLWLIWGFSANRKKDDAFHATVRPPRLGGNERLGVFATRSPFRPNPLGLSSVKIVKVENGEIIVSGADLMNGTPIYDIKPYLPYVDSHPDVSGGFTDDRQWSSLKVSLGHNIRNPFSIKETEALIEVLSQDPRPQYQHDADRIYGMPYAGHDVRFRVDGDELEVVEIR